MAKGEGGGRPRADVDLHKLKALMRLHPTIEDTAAFFDVSIKTIERLVREEFQVGFVAFREQNAVHTRLNITRALIGKAEKGDLGAMIWYMKNKMGWSDKVETKSEITEIKTFKIGWSDEAKDNGIDSAIEDTTTEENPGTQ